MDKEFCEKQKTDINAYKMSIPTATSSQEIQITRVYSGMSNNDGVIDIEKLYQHDPPVSRTDPCQRLQPSSRNTSLDIKRLNIHQARVKPGIDEASTDVSKILRIHELDKFKRRLIRTIARLMLEEKKPEEEIWEELKKETSCDCKLLWARMRALTIKKLKRLFAAGDRNDNITTIAQLSVTDWLLFDLVLVHDDVDVIEQDTEGDNKKDPPILEDLFKLVMKYKIEHLSGDRLTLAWYNLTKDYNSRGRTCSPMLLQRRWYQMKEHVRLRFYNFWFEYRGILKKLERADKYKPTTLQMEIVKVYMFIVTNPFQSWEQLIKDKKVSLPADFERLQLSKKKKLSTENESDIELIESHVETIDLGLESDEDSRETNNSASDDSNKNSDNIDLLTADSMSNDGNPNVAKIKTEPLYDLSEEHEVRALESMRIPLESNSGQVSNEPIHKTQESTIGNQIVRNISYDHIKDKEGLTICELADNIASTDVPDQQDDFEIVMPKITSVTSTAQIPENNVIYEIPDEINDKLERVADEISKNKFLVPKFSEINKNKQDILGVEKENILGDIAEVVTDKEHKLDQNFCNEVVPNDELHLVEGIELVDDGIEYIDEDGQMTETRMEIIEEDDNQRSKIDDANSSKIDIKLLLNPVVYTKKLDHMNVFRSIDYVLVKDSRVIKKAVDESKPIDKNAVKTDISPELTKNILGYEHSESTSKNKHETIKSTSWLFRKPWIISYNPIQLCKNPDFNTRLKRLTVGFLSSQRNRQLLKQCKPLTVDVHKAFEEKLVNNSLLIKTNNVSEAKHIELIKTVEKTVLPSQLPGQSLICDVQDSIQSISTLSKSTKNQASKCNKSEVHAIERNKVINLPDIDQIRRTNERLLIAEVTPLQPLNATYKPPVSIVNENTLFEQNSQLPLLIEREDILNNIDTSTTSKVTSTLKSNPCSGINNDIPEAIMKNNNESNKCSSDGNNTSLTYQQLLKSLNKIKRNLKPTNKLRLVSVTWNPNLNSKPINYKRDDRLLAADTVERIISVCKGFYLPLSKKNQRKLKKKKIKAQLYQQKKDNQNINNQEILITNVETMLPVEGQQQKQATVQNRNFATDEKEKMIIIDVNQNNNDSQQQKKSEEKKKYVINKKKIVFCCWAREKLEFWNGNIKRVKTSHLCPQSKCVCCCNIEFCEILKQRRENKYQKSISFYNLVSDDESDPNSDKLNKFQNPSQISQPTQNDGEIHRELLKVSIGINTDFDKEFEESYAHSLNNLNLNNSVEIIDEPRPSDNQQSYSLGTQTDTYKNFDPVSLINSIIKSAATKTNENNISPVITNVQSIKSTQVPRPGMEKNHETQTKYRKCITKVFPAPSRINRTLRISSTDGKKQDVLNTKKDLGITESIQHENDKINDKIIDKIGKKTVILNKAKDNINQSPICLGKNKILLCSLKPLNKTSMIDVTHLVEDFEEQNKPCQDMPLLIPKGVHFVLLPNQELVLSIDPGVELDPNQIANLPTIIASVQQKLFSLGVIKNLPHINTNAPKNDDVIHLSDDETDDTITNKSQDISNVEINNEIKNESDVNTNDIEMGITASKIRKSDAQSVKHSTGNSTNQLVDKDKDEVIREAGQNSTSEGHMQDYTLSNNIHVALDLTKKGGSKNVDSSKKTILSDLMEMSGISLEDTTITNTESPLKEQTSFPEVPLSETKSNILHTNNEVAGSDLLLNNPFVQAALTKCPDLRVVYSFNDLKYAHESDGQFYKMDITTGIIVPINVSIKKRRNQLKILKKSNSPKTVIDLTEEDKDETQTFEIEKEIPLSNTNDKTNTSDIEGNKNIKPIKLIKAIHTSILKHNFNTLSMHKYIDNSCSNLHGKKIIKVIKRKKHINKNIDLNFGEKNENSSEKINKLKDRDKVNHDNDSESDDEPLAFVAKRIKHHILPGTSQRNIPVEGPEGKNQEDKLPSQLESSTSYNVTENMQEDFDLNQEEPVIFQCNNESSEEEDCILGV